MKRIGILLSSLFLLNMGLMAQDTGTDNHTISVGVPEVAILDIESDGSTALSLAFTEPTEAGLGVEGSSNNDLWLNYSSVKSLVNTTRSVSVRIDQALAGADIKVVAAGHAGNGAGTLGTPSGEITLTTSDQVLINSIGSCYTGNGVNNGHNLTYTLDVGGSYADLEAEADTPVTVTYTIAN